MDDTLHRLMIVACSGQQEMWCFGHSRHGQILDKDRDAIHVSGCQTISYGRRILLGS